ncbi:hypothetical protein GCM10010384_15840 [Streptomyces djakartensis]|uniref:Uncharacterized protein n=1 Tax=Streptomyces djakartensis TaxID=68193 RepID=A0ABQ2ZDG1_9ACTN|nr:hypothetical protein GCM10010384_15840 [Streptomyces djakartensis]
MTRTARTAAVLTGSGSLRRRAGSSTHRGRLDRCSRGSRAFPPAPGASYRSAVPITLSLPTASRPLPLASEDPRSPVAALLALYYAAQVRDAAPVADSAPISYGEGRATHHEDSQRTKNFSQPPK